ncbi:MAG: GTPase HflX [Bacteroidales bacterium]
MPEYIKTIPEAERAVLVGLILPGQDERVTLDYLNELAFLAETAGAIPLKKFTQKLDAPNPKTFVGTGKMREIADCVKELEADLLIFDDELSPSQLRNVEQMAKCKVLDRTSLILDIFARRARTSYAKVQVELAQYQYILPRLAGMWTHLERQRGGIGLRGPGEREIETDRRVIRDRIARLQDHLKQIDRQMVTQRKNRGKYVRVALVGYTNAGKSTLMNLLSKSDVFAENKLFATLDTTVRKVIIDNLPFLLSDTVGFIRKLPHHLVESFKSTLDEVREADILIHVVDISHAGFEEQIRVVEETLHDLEAADKPTYLVFNKIDAYTHIPRDEDDLTPPEAGQYSLDELKNTWMGRNNRSSIFISAREKTNLPELKRILYEKVREIHVNRYPYENFLY